MKSLVMLVEIAVRTRDPEDIENALYELEHRDVPLDVYNGTKGLLESLYDEDDTESV